MPLGDLLMHAGCEREASRRVPFRSWQRATGRSLHKYVLGSRILVMAAVLVVLGNWYPSKSRAAPNRSTVRSLPTTGLVLVGELSLHKSDDRKQSCVCGNRLWWKAAARGMLQLFPYRSQCIVLRGIAHTELPLAGLPLPDRFVGTGYYLLNVLVRREGAPSDIVLKLMLDTGLSASVLLLSSTCERLQIQYAKGTRRGLGATGNVPLGTMQLPGAELQGVSDNVLLNSMSGVVVDDFQQSRIGDEVGVSIDGMLGQGFLHQCVLELDPWEQRAFAWSAGEAFKSAYLIAAQHSNSIWVELPALRLPLDLLGVLLSVPGASEPVLGIVDTGASHSVVNMRAAHALGLTPSSMQSQDRNWMVSGVGLGGIALEMPLVVTENVTLSGAAHILETASADDAIERGPWSFSKMTCQTKHTAGPFSAVAIAVGDIGLFDELFSDARLGRFRGPAALIGQDLLTQRAMRISSRTRQIWFRISKSAVGE